MGILSSDVCHTHKKSLRWSLGYQIAFHRGSCLFVLDEDDPTVHFLRDWEGANQYTLLTVNMSPTARIQAIRSGT